MPLPPSRQLALRIGGLAIAVLLLTPMKNIRAQEVLLLRPGNPAEIGQGETIDLFRGDPTDRWIGHIQTPTLTVLLPSPERATGIAVIICPGGGYSRELYDREGLDVARWLNRIGVAGIVLKYRLPTGKYANGEDAMPLEDALRAVRLVRSRAAEWKLDANRIGLMGFSAGGHVAATAGTLFAEGSPTATDPVERLSSRADFLALIYPQISMQPDLGRKNEYLLGPNPSAELRRKYSPELQITPQTPPSFLVLCGDDPFLSPEHVTRFYSAAHRAGVPSELHLYETGGHGFGVQGLDEPGARSWPHRFEAWLAAHFAAPRPAASTALTPAPAMDALSARARSVLHQIMESERSWIRVHAAEALIGAGEGDAIRTYFLNELPGTEKSEFRIGVWRVLTTTSPSREERTTWIAKIEQVYLDPTAPDQNQAIETLCKLGYHVSGEALAKVRRNAAGPPGAPMALALWSGVLAGEPHALDGLIGLLASKDPALRTSAAYSLRWLHPHDAAVREALARAAAAEPAGTVPYVYILGAALTLGADPSQAASWETKLNEVMFTGEAGPRFEASWTLKRRYQLADLPRLAPVLDLPVSENDARVGAASIILTTLALK